MTKPPDTRIARLAVVPLLVAALLALPACDRIASPIAFSGVIEPSIRPQGETRYTPIERTFPFEGRTVTVSVPVDQAVYEGAMRSEKRALRFGNAVEADWIPDYYRAFIDESHQETFYESLLAALRQVRDREKLDRDRYAELILAMTQSLTYRTDPVNLSPKFTVETFAHGDGDCDDKTLLAAGLLAREGYDVAVLIFDAEKHVALGLRAPGLEYKSSGYAYVETTAGSLVGVPPDKLAGGVVLGSEPQVVRVGTGTLAYRQAAQITYIRERMIQVRADEKRLAAEIADYDRRMSDQREALSSQRPSGAATKDEVEAYNAKVRAYNALVSERNGVVRRHNAMVELERFASEHLNDRVGLFARLKSAG